MNPRTVLCLVALALASTAGGRAASAQLSGDSASLARATATAVGDSLLPRLMDGTVPRLGQPTTPFDWEVTLLLRDAHGLALMPTVERPVEWVVTRGVAMSGDTAAVLVEIGAALEERPDRTIDTYIEPFRYVFVRTAGGWCYLRREFVRGADIGRVRG